MLIRYRVVRKAAATIAAASDSAVEALREGRVEQEPAMTDRMLGAIEQALRGATIGGIRWEAKTLTDRGQGAQEREYGADFLGVVSIDLADYSVSKGFLAQAKIRSRLRRADTEGLKAQCKRMLEASAVSFVFLYSDNGITIVPAISVVAANGFVDELYSRSMQRFFEDHLECFIGDRAINSPTPATLAALRERREARSALLIQARVDETVDALRVS